MIETEDYGAYEGHAKHDGEPDWGPLERLAEDDPLVLGGFMWMFSVRLEDGRTLQAYKHHVTRRYLHLAGDLAAFEYHGDAEKEEYVSVPLALTLRDCFCHHRELGLVEEDEILAAEALIERHTSRPRSG